MQEIFITSRGTKIKVNIPERTPEEQKQRDREIEHNMIAIYKKLEKEGNLHILNKKMEEAI